MSKIAIRQNIHLLISTVIVIPVAVVYGLFPKTILPQLLDFSVETTDLTNVFRAIMGLYLAFASLWILGMFKPNYWKAATISNILFMAGLAFGRIISLFLDGFPSTVFLMGTAGELVLAIFGMAELQYFNAKKTNSTKIY
jgi:hypothetical protein